MSQQEFDVVVLGAGPGGEVTAGRLGQNGLRVALVEAQLVGGECSFFACMPSKALLRPAEAMAEARRIPGVREAISGALDVEVVLSRRDEVIHKLDDSGQLPWLDAHGVELHRGRGRLDGERCVVVDDGDVLLAKRAVVIATGSGAAIPPVPGLRELPPWTNREATTASAVPRSLVILGGGVVGVEMAQAWSSLGSRVTLIEAEARLISREEPFAAEQVGEALREQGVDVRLGVRAEIVARGSDGVVTVTLSDGELVEGSELLVAVGRRPLTEGIGLETVGLVPGQALEVDRQMRVPGYQWLYAVGDVNELSLLTHMGKYQARIAADTILGRDVAMRGDGLDSPRVIFTDPQVAAVGLTLEVAQQRGLRVRAVDHPTSATAGASFHGKGQPGTSRIVVDDDRRVLVGATFTGPDVAEWLHAATIAIVAGVTLEQLWHAIPAFPTRSEVWLRLMEGYGL